MKTACQTRSFEWQPLGRREVVAAFCGRTITSDAGGVLLREVEERTGLLARFAGGFDDHRDPDKVEHPVHDLLKPRIFGLCLGDEDLNDHETLRRDPLLAVLVGKEDPMGQDRASVKDRGCPLARNSTLNRLELSPVGADAKSRPKKIVARTRDIEDFFVKAYFAWPPRRQRSSNWTSMRPTIRGLGISSAGSFMATTRTASCRCTSSAGGRTRSASRCDVRAESGSWCGRWLRCGGPSLDRTLPRTCCSLRSEFGGNTQPECNSACPPFSNTSPNGSR